ncbi:hypothetical protein DFH06DRAFT_182969 [Mycena polygramma]|nr:hypothetical protein DFH06DRAFT_182969 [Mycena polygramma]
MFFTVGVPCQQGRGAWCGCGVLWIFALILFCTTTYHGHQDSTSTITIHNLLTTFAFASMNININLNRFPARCFRLGVVRCVTWVFLRVPECGCATRFLILPLTTINRNPSSCVLRLSLFHPEASCTSWSPG